MRVELEPIPNYGYHMNIKRFADKVNRGVFTDSDGFGNYATHLMMSNWEISPSKFDPNNVPAWATYVVWFNR